MIKKSSYVPQRNRKWKKFRFGLALTLLGAILTVLFSLNKSETSENDFLVSSSNTTEHTITTAPLKNSLGEVVEKVVNASSGDYAVVVKNLKTNEEYASNEHKVYQSASLYKLWVMGEVYRQLREGTLKEDQVLRADIAALNQEFQLDLEYVELKSGTIELTIQQALEQMITISHNYAAMLLSRKAGSSNIAKFMKDNGLNESSFSSPPQTTASDIASFFEKLYQGEIIDEDSSQKMLDLLSRQQLNNGLPKNLPVGTKVAHKTGEIGWFKHDGGIVFTDQGDFIIIVLSESDYPLGAQARIAEISKAVFDYYSKPQD